jgi:hypothetical protein
MCRRLLPGRPPSDRLALQEPQERRRLRSRRCRVRQPFPVSSSLFFPAKRGITGDKYLCLLSRKKAWLFLQAGGNNIS